MKTSRISAICTLVATLLLPASAGAAMSTAWTYQGELSKAGVLYSGSADFRFSLWTAESGGSQSGDTIPVINVPVAGGRFSVQLDFGKNPFDHEQSLWLAIEVRTPSSPTGPFTALGNRQPITPSPYAIRTRGMFVTDDGRVGVGASTAPDFDLQASRTRTQSLGPAHASVGVRHDQLSGILPNITRETNWLYMAAGQDGVELARNESSDLRFVKEGAIWDTTPSLQMTLTATGKLLLGTSTERAPLQLQVGDWFGVTYDGRVGFNNYNPQAKLHFSNGSSVDCIRFPNGTVQNSAPFTDAGFRSGTGVAPSDKPQFVSVRLTVTIKDNSQKIFVVATQQFSASDSEGLDLYIGYREFGSTEAPRLVGVGLKGNTVWDDDCTGDAFCAGNTLPVTLSAVIDYGLPPGNYEVGIVGVSTKGYSWDAGQGYVSAFVF